jgi:hypothetical protein
MNKMTWLDLYNYLYQQANNIQNFGNFNWDEPVIYHDVFTGDEYHCDTFMISTQNNKEKLVLMTSPNNN